jgi:GDP-4-dehydro-6-deoxy-D-mannose reductase
MTRRAFITGVSGFAGRHLAELLVSEGWSVAGTVRHRSADLPTVAEHRLEIDDATGIRAVLAEFQPDVVYHLAAVVDTVTTPDVLALYRTNVIGTAAVLEAIGSVGSVRRVLVASSAFAYGRTPPDLQPVQETAALEPLTAYGASKVATEAIALQWRRLTGVDVVITRAFQHTGPGHVGSYALADWAGQLASGASVIRVGNLDVARDYLDVRDVVAAYRVLAETGRAGEIYNVGSGVPVTMASLLDGLVEAFGGHARVEIDPTRLRTVDQPVFYADIQRLMTDTTWAPRFTLRETLQDLADWWRSRQ